MIRSLGKLRYLKEARNVRSLWMAYHYLKPCLRWKDDCTYMAYGENPTVRLNKTIWVYWKQGLDNAPELVKCCISSIQQYARDYDVVVLDKNNLKDYIKMPEFIHAKHESGIIKEALFSDLLRISLIIQYGGIWCDATCFWSKEIPFVVERSPFFMFSESMMMSNITPIIGSNWFLKGEKDNVILTKTRNCLFNYWKRHSYLPNYFIFHLLLSAIVRRDQEANRCWKKVPYICNMNAHVVQFHLADRYDEDLYDYYIDNCFVHKLTYKYDDILLKADSENNLQHILKLRKL